MKAEIILEVSWEVCNKVGGIYTVIKSKADKIVENYRENYFLIGPYFARQAIGEFEEKLPKGRIKEIFEKLDKEGIKCHFGKWLVKGAPSVVLIDFTNINNDANTIKRKLWDDYRIDSLNAPYDYNEPVTWSYAVYRFIKEFSGLFNKNIVCQFHEWLAGSALLHLKRDNVDIATIFTTHATVLGRTMSGNNIDLYCRDGDKKCFLEKIDIDKEAHNYGVAAKHQIEKNSALNADVFTTVSEITGMEAGFILGRKPEVLLPNGLDIEKFPTFEEISIKHRLQRTRIREFLLYYFMPYYVFDLKESLFFFIAGRYEFHDKGIDVLIKALGGLNDALKKEKSKKTVVAFIWVPANIRGIKSELLESKTFYDDIKEYLEEAEDDIEESILYSFVSRKRVKEEELFDQDFLLEMKGRVLKLKRKGNPSISTHDLYDNNDIILKTLLEAGLDNKEDDRVKVVYYPVYLSGADGLLNLTFYEAMQGSHLGIFPSFYEPWGYTPLEAGALGVSSVTTDLAGFGRYIEKESSGKKDPGIFVLKRMGRKEEQVVKDLKDFMHYYVNLSKRGRIENKMAARRLAEMADWKLLIKNYIGAFNEAFKKRDSQGKGK